MLLLVREVLEHDPVLKHYHNFIAIKQVKSSFDLAEARNIC